MQKRKSKSKYLGKLIAEIVKSPSSNPYELSYALAARRIEMSPQLIYYHLNRLNLRSASSRLELQKEHEKRKKSNSGKKQENC